LLPERFNQAFSAKFLKEIKYLTFANIGIDPV